MRRAGAAGRPVEDWVLGKLDRPAAGGRVWAEVCAQLRSPDGKIYWWVGSPAEFAALLRSGVVEVKPRK